MQTPTMRITFAMTGVPPLPPSRTPAAAGQARQGGQRLCGLLEVCGLVPTPIMKITFPMKGVSPLHTSRRLLCPESPGKEHVQPENHQPGAAG